MTSSARQPRGVLLLNGTPAVWESVTVTSNAYYEADQFTVTLPVASLPTGFQLADLADVAEIDAEVRISLDGGQPTSLIIGRVETIEVDFAQGGVTLSGRDHTSDFIEAKTTGATYRNQTASQIIQSLAANHGLTASVTATKTRVGTYFSADHDKLTNEVTEWDLMTYLAQQEGFDVYVTGRVVNFQPSGDVRGDVSIISFADATATSTRRGNFIGLTAKRSLTLASDVLVKVSSWDKKSGRRFVATGKATKAKGAKSTGTPQIYSFKLPGGHSKDDAQKYAHEQAEQITRHEKLLTLHVPGDLTTVAGGQVKLVGTGTGFDQLYWVDEVERSLSFDSGFDMKVTMKNHSSQSVVTI